MDEADREGAIAGGSRSRLPSATPSTALSDWDAERWLEPGEHVFARRSVATLERREPVACDRPPSGDLYVTSERLFLAGAARISIALAEIDEAALVAGNLVLLLREGVGVTIRCDQPQELRAEIAAARASRNDAVALARDDQRSPR
jgi:hypothetical protein